MVYGFFILRISTTSETRFFSSSSLVVMGGGLSDGLAMQSGSTPSPNT